jgi:16S rRNA (cytosine1402-N4)-methyltransferase
VAFSPGGRIVAPLRALRPGSCQEDIRGPTSAGKSHAPLSLFSAESPEAMLSFRPNALGGQTARVNGVERDQIEHEPVLADELLLLVSVRPGETVVDATIGHGGHARRLAEAIGPAGRLIGLDVDPRNLERARARLQQPGAPHLDLFRANFAELEPLLDGAGVAQVDVILADLGVSTDQLLDPSKGLTFTQDAPLDMRLDDRLERSAADLVNSLSESELADLLFFNAQEHFSRRIAKRICQARRERRIRRTSELVRIVCSAQGVSPAARPGRIHPATRTFLALRMAVNHELENLRALLSAAPRRLAGGGRIAVISFHSGEDRVVKHDFLDRQRAGVYEVITRKPVSPGVEEVRRNPRSRSAKLRVAARTEGPKEAA